MKPKKPCPGCGVVPRVQKFSLGYSIYCENENCVIPCNLEGYYDTPSDAVQLWDAPRWYEPPAVDEVPPLDAQRRESIVEVFAELRQVIGHQLDHINSPDDLLD